MDNIQTNHRDYGQLAWGAIFIWWGITEMFNFLPEGTGALGLGLILLGVNAARSLSGAAVSAFSVTVGILALVWGGLEMAGALLSLPFQLPVFAILLMLLGFGFSLPLANLRILFPDLGEIITVGLQLWRWTLPVMFSDAKFPKFLKHLMSLNPPYYFIRSFRDVLIEHRMPPQEAWLSMAFWIVVTMIIAQLVAGWLRHEVKDLL